MQMTETMQERFAAVRARSVALCAPLTAEDTVVQTMPDVSPTKWHLAHTTWFFETFVLRGDASYRPFHPAFEMLFNSYYNTVGEQFPRPRRGELSRPGLAEILRYREHVDAAVRDRLGAGVLPESLLALAELGLHHEQQHQELMLTDIKHVLAANPLHPVYREMPVTASTAPAPLRWLRVDPGLCEVGFQGEGFSFDNERPRHQVVLAGAELADRLVTNGEYLEFMQAGGYEDPRLWLSDGWARAQEESWHAPLYWFRDDDRWMQFTLSGARPVDPHEPVCHLSQYEADAYATWRGARLPTEFEWEALATDARVAGNLAESDRLHPVALTDSVPGQPAQLFGDVWEWTQSAYLPYPGFRAPEGAVGEYNGKFMSGQMVLRGGSCVTPQSHVRPTYRNFFPPHARWQFAGLRLARDLDQA